MAFRFFILIVAAYSSSAVAQSRSRLEQQAARIPEGRELTPTQNRRLMSEFAVCSVKTWRAGMERYLDTEPGSPEAVNIGKNVSTGDCLMSGEIRFDESLFRAASYDAMYRAKFYKEGPSDFSEVLPIDYGRGSEQVAKLKGLPHTVLRRLADCTVRAGPKEARNLIMSPIGGSREATAFDAITPFLASCMTDDVTLQFTRASLRGFIGEALYRLSMKAVENSNARLPR